MSRHVPFTRAVGTSKLASSFCEAAARQPLDLEPQPLVTYFLMGHALELGWKSVLIAEGTTQRELRRIGHDLREARDRAGAFLGAAVGATPEVVAITDMMADYYKAKVLEYLEPGYYSLPLPGQAVSTVGHYVHSLREWVDGRVRARLRNGDQPE